MQWEVVTGHRVYVRWRAMTPTPTSGHRVLPWPGGEVELQLGSSMASYMLLGAMMLPRRTHVPHALTVWRGGYDGMGQDRDGKAGKATKEYDIVLPSVNKLHLLGYITTLNI